MDSKAPFRQDDRAWPHALPVEGFQGKITEVPHGALVVKQVWLNRNMPVPGADGTWMVAFDGVQGSFFADNFLNLDE